MHVADCPLTGPKVIALDVYGDRRGFFVERFSAPKFGELGLPTAFVQDNHSRSAPGILRGLHYQWDPPQGKLVGVIRGKILDVVVDIRMGSATFGQHYAVELSDENGKLLWVPPGFAHGFCVLGEEPVDMIYKVTAPYNPKGEGGIRFNDAALGIQWPVANPTVSDRDKGLQDLAAYRAAPVTWG